MQDNKRVLKGFQTNKRQLLNTKEIDARLSVTGKNLASETDSYAKRNHTWDFLEKVTVYKALAEKLDLALGNVLRKKGHSEIYNDVLAAIARNGKLQKDKGIVHVGDDLANLE